MLDPKTAGEAKFIDQMTRKLMVTWCHQAIANPSAPMSFHPDHQTYKDYATKKGWLSSKDGWPLAAGWSTAAAFLKR